MANPKVVCRRATERAQRVKSQEMKAQIAEQLLRKLISLAHNPRDMVKNGFVQELDIGWNWYIEYSGMVSSNFDYRSFRFNVIHILLGESPTVEELDHLDEIFESIGWESARWWWTFLYKELDAGNVVHQEAPGELKGREVKKETEDWRKTFPWNAENWMKRSFKYPHEVKND